MAKKITSNEKDLYREKALSGAKEFFVSLEKLYGFEIARWAFGKVIDLNSTKVRLLKRKEQLEKELKEINKEI